MRREILPPSQPTGRSAVAVQPKSSPGGGKCEACDFAGLEPDSVSEAFGNTNYCFKRERRAPCCGQGRSEHPRAWARGRSVGAPGWPLGEGRLRWNPAVGARVRGRGGCLSQAPWASSRSGPPSVWRRFSRSPPLSGWQPSILQPAAVTVRGGMGSTPGQSPHLHLGRWETALFLQDLGPLGCGPAAEGGWRLDVAVVGGWGGGRLRP